MDPYQNHNNSYGNQAYKPGLTPPSYEEVVPSPDSRRPAQTSFQQGYESDDYGFNSYREQRQAPLSQTPQAPQVYRGEQYSPPWYDPRYWSRRKVIIVSASVLIVIIIIVAAAAASASKNKHSSYPDYSPLTYALKDTYEGENFFDNFNYFTGYDPTSGFVHYVPQAQAQQLNLTYASASAAVLKVDTSVGPSSNPNASTGRFSVRVESKKTYNDGLFIFDVRHTPYGCGTWPALWLTDPSNWPEHGEIDIMESTNQGTSGNQMTLHTSSGCSMDVKRKESFKPLQTNCDATKNGNAGCGVEGGSDTFGAAFNGNGSDQQSSSSGDDGGFMAVEWRDDGIRIWQWARSKVPADIASKKPTPQNWGQASADFPKTNCNIGSHFKNQTVVIDINLCGDLVNSDWSKSGCQGTCTDLVANQPDAFNDAYWEFGSFEVYQA